MRPLISPSGAFSSEEFPPGGFPAGAVTNMEDPHCLGLDREIDLADVRISPVEKLPHGDCGSRESSDGEAAFRHLAQRQDRFFQAAHPLRRVKWGFLNEMAEEGLQIMLRPRTELNAKYHAGPAVVRKPLPRAVLHHAPPAPALHR